MFEYTFEQLKADLYASQPNIGEIELIMSLLDYSAEKLTVPFTKSAEAPESISPIIPKPST